MRNVTMGDLIPVIILYTLLLIFMYYAYRFLRRRKKRHANSYPTDMNGFNKAVEDEDIQSMQLFGDRIIWNEHLEQSDKKIIYHAVKPRVKLNSELKQLWKDVHYKTHGHEPFENQSKDDEWTSNSNYSSSRDDIIDQ